MGNKKIKTRIYDIAKEYSISSDALLKVLRGLGFTIKSHMSVASEDMLEAIASKFKREIEEVKKGDEVRKQKLLELEAKKRREEAEKTALRRKAETLAKKKKAAAAKRAKEKAAQELARLKKDDEAKVTVEAEKAVEEKKVVKIKATEKIIESKPEVTPIPETPKPKPQKMPPQQPAKAAAPKDSGEKKAPARETSKKKKRPGKVTTISVTPDAARKIEKKLQSNVGSTRPPKKRRKRDRSGRGKAAHKVDTAAVKLSFKKTMATLDGIKKGKKYKKRVAGDEMIDTGAPSIEVTEFMTLSELSKQLEKQAAELVAKCMELGMLASINQRLDIDTIEMLALEFGFNIREVDEPAAQVIEAEVEKNLQPRSPVVTIMGHVDHGKTTLLDYIRKSNVVSTEAGKITQHIGAYKVSTKGGTISFLDTPGHEAFSSMRARGAQLTDIVVLVVSATEAVMPQTVEAINHSLAAGVPIIVAINKMDLDGANPESVRQQLSKHNLLDESWGGKTIMVELSSKTGEGIDKLLEMILLQAEMMELKADPDIKSQGTIVEARLEKGRGPVATVLMHKGTLRIGNPFVAGSFYGRVRAMMDDLGKSITEAGPSTPVQITGLSGVPRAGEAFTAAGDEAEARSIALKRQQIKREFDIRRSAPTTLESVYEKIKDGQVSDLKIIIKADVAGSAEALSETLTSIGNEEVRVNIIHSGVGAINESDVLLAVPSDAIIVGFHVTADPRARERAIKEKIDIRTYRVIYEAKENITRALEGLLKPDMVEKWVGNVEVRQPFKVPKVGTICGSFVQQGRIKRGDRIRVSRNGIIIHEGTISSLKRFKDDAREVAAGFECGVGVENFNDVKAGDLIEAFELIEVERKLQ